MSTSADSTQHTGQNTDGTAYVALNIYRPAILGVLILRPPEPLALVSGGGMGLHWQDWLEDFMKGSQVTDPVQQLIALRNLNGTEVGQIIKELPADMASSYQGVPEALNREFLHKRNIDYKRYSFNLASQEKDESMGEFISQLKRLAQYCAFDTFTMEDALRLWITEGC
ncbi:hypothetical protein NDU88_003627 [Pleurodeles waltl]|uniref:Retrotransposon gag domain-containing protein n=1 Tax=Pleurodeles waltl TaxID=8319 RepID=A0AAV7LFY4_PLEWA|nr:hypothetical protein NDU88_003627 [Pleurodeles waltl]